MNNLFDETLTTENTIRNLQSNFHHRFVLLFSCVNSKTIKYHKISFDQFNLESLLSFFDSVEMLATQFQLQPFNKYL